MSSSLFSSCLSKVHSGRLAIVAGENRCTYEDFFHGIDGLTRILRGMGVEKGSRVALWSYNCANWLISFFAVVKAGGTAVLLNYSMNAKEASELLKLTETSFLLCGDNGETKKDPEAGRKLAALAGIPEEHYMDIRPLAIDLSKAFPDAAEEKELRSEEEAEDTAFIIFTSGTTSMPKAVRVSQQALSFDAQAFNGNVSGQGGNSACVAVPLFHILGLLMSYSYLCRGATVCLPADYKPDTLVREIDAYRISDMAAVGAVYIALSEHESFPDKVAPYLHLCMIAGGMSTPVQMMRLELEYNNAIFINMYGQSEAAPLTMVVPSDLVEKRAQTVGKAIDGLDVRVSDGKGGFLPQGQIGEVIAKGLNLMNGYDRLPEDKQPIDDDGWLHTGDLGYFDEDGFLHLSGRIKDVIIRGGENISPSEIEAAINQLESIKEVKVLGAPHPIYGESVEACVTMKDKNAVFDPESIKSFLRTLIPRFKIPSHIFRYDSFPLNVNGKLDQRSLKADLLNRLRELELNEELAGGVTVFDLVVKNSDYAIVPVASLVSELTESVGFAGCRIKSIRLAVEEMLTERIMDAYSASGDIRVRITLMPEWFRVSFSDNGAEYFIDKRRDTSMSARMILYAVSDFHTDYHDGKPVYCMDFQYETDVDIREFLMRSKQAGEQPELAG